MALIDSKQLNPALTGSFTLQGGIVGDSTSTGSFNAAEVGTLDIDSLFTYGSTTWNETSGNNTITGSVFKFKGSSATEILSAVNNSGETVFRVGDKFLVMGARSSAPSAMAGGIYYDDSDEWYLGFDS
jgi:hypothetical protein|tara:strand:- start:415 stop:798 length:384 start_codon:yes stop_codon:yes gene_type:complete